MDISKAEKFIYHNARPLELARWQYLFENGSRESVLKALAAYQNEDGGFGHALEADCWNPDSSPVQTWAATQIINEVGLCDNSHPIIRNILRYLDSTEDFDGHTWSNTIPSNNGYPHAPWWNYAPTQDINYNPTASLTGFALRYAAADSSLYRKACVLAEEAYAWFKENCPTESMHTAACFAQLYEYLSDCGSAVIDLDEFESLLKKQIKYILTADTSVWATEYVCLPSLFIHSKASPFYAENKELCNCECRFISETQGADGSWAITWEWSDYPEQWHISKNWWKSDLIIKNIKFYKSIHG
ncbi:MAG: hypothetical protein ACI4GA_02770 [Acutalibacteraceae bacterium]|nr:hypothetical protein [Oscillospiraceae bacterium]